jgi:hypothetical protein
MRHSSYTGNLIPPTNLRVSGVVPLACASSYMCLPGTIILRGRPFEVDDTLANLTKTLWRADDYVCE